jgi:hypothetical protein
MTIDVLLTTWPNHPLRMNYFCRTVEALRENLSAGGHPLRYRAFAERERDARHRWMGKELEAFCRANEIQLDWKPAPANLGRLLNLIYGSSESDLRLYIQDDWLLEVPLDIGAAADHLLARDDCGGIRFWANTRFSGVDGPWLAVDRNADWAYGDNPALWHRRFFDRYGPFEEGGGFGTHECSMNLSVRTGPLKILTVPEMAKDASHYFRHIGEISSLPNETRWADRDRNQARE